MGAQPLKCGQVFGLNPDEWDIKQFSAGHYDDVDAFGNFVATEQLTRDPFGAIALNRFPHLSRRRHAKPCMRAAIRDQEDREQPAPQLRSLVIRSLEVGALPDPLLARETLSGDQRRDPSSATVSFFLPLARRRLSTIRPFFVAIRTRKPWAFFRRRVFG